MRPPPSSAPDDAPEVVDVPRMEPPPPSLGAMVESRQGDSRPEPRSQWWLWVVVVVVAAAITAYVTR